MLQNLRKNVFIYILYLFKMQKAHGHCHLYKYVTLRSKQPPPPIKRHKLFSLLKLSLLIKKILLLWHKAAFHLGFTQNKSHHCINIHRIFYNVCHLRQYPVLCRASFTKHFYKMTPETCLSYTARIFINPLVSRSAPTVVTLRG